MHQKLVDLDERRQRLVLKAASQRAMLARNMGALKKPLAMADRSLQVIRYFKKHPILMLGVTALSGSIFHKIRLARFSALLQTSWSVFQLVRNVLSPPHKD